MFFVLPIFKNHKITVIFKNFIENFLNNRYTLGENRPGQIEYYLQKNKIRIRMPAFKIYFTNLI